VDLVRDLLDKMVVDRNGREVGRVDSVVLEVRAGAPPLVTAIEIGPSVLANRLHRLLGRWVEALEHGLGVDQGRPLRIPQAAILEVADHIRVDLAFAETSAGTVEQRLRRWVSAIPGS
jgi:sporulation protein YlmC with PRC-barrel domain